MRSAALLLVVLAGLYACSGARVIQQDEIGLVRRFGALQREPWQPGLHWGLPWPLDRLDRLQVGQTRTLSIGASGDGGAPLAQAPDPLVDERLTGDLNLVTVEATIQYRVAAPADYLYGTVNVDAWLAAAAESTLVRALASRGVDDALTTGRAGVAEAMASDLQTQGDRLGLGVTIRAIRLGRVAPPAPVADAFADAARARSDKRQRVTQAEEYRDKTQAEARSVEREIADQAAAQHDRSIELARGEADRFAGVLAEAANDPAATRARLYLETVSVLLPAFTRTIVVPVGETVDLSLFADTPAPATSP